MTPLGQVQLQKQKEGCIASLNNSLRNETLNGGFILQWNLETGVAQRSQAAG